MTHGYVVTQTWRHDIDDRTIHPWVEDQHISFVSGSVGNFMWCWLYLILYICIHIHVRTRAHTHIHKAHLKT